MPQLAGPPQSLPSITDSLSAFPLLEPKRQQQLQDRLEAPLIGLAAAPPCASAPELLLFQLSAAGDVFYQHLRLQRASSHPAPERPAPRAAAPPVDQAPAPSWSSQARARCSRWLEALMELPPTHPVWTAPTFSHRRFLGHMERQKSQETVARKLRAAMAKGRLLRPGDLSTLPRAEPPPAPQCSQPDELTERLAEAWEGRTAAWWRRHHGQTAGPQAQSRRPKRRTQLSSTFSSFTSYLDAPDASGALSQALSTSEACPHPPGIPPSQEATPELWAQGVPRERRQTLRDYMTRLPPLRDSPGPVATPPSQASSLQTASFSQQTPILSGSQRPRKRPRMGF